MSSCSIETSWSNWSTLWVFIVGSIWYGFNLIRYTRSIFRRCVVDLCYSNIAHTNIGCIIFSEHAHKLSLITSDIYSKIKLDRDEFSSFVFFLNNLLFLQTKNNDKRKNYCPARFVYLGLIRYSCKHLPVSFERCRYVCSRWRIPVE